VKEKMHRNNLFHLGFVEVISSPRKGIIKGVFIVNRLASRPTDSWTKTTNTHEQSSRIQQHSKKP